MTKSDIQFLAKRVASKILTAIALRLQRSVPMTHAEAEAIIVSEIPESLAIPDPAARPRP